MLDIDEKLQQSCGNWRQRTESSIDQLLATYVPGLRSAESNGKGLKDAAAAFDEWADSFGQEAPPLSDEAVSRRSIYRMRDLKSGAWQTAYLGFTGDGRRNDGSDSPLAAGHLVDDLFFFIEPDGGKEVILLVY